MEYSHAKKNCSSNTLILFVSLIDSERRWIIFITLLKESALRLLDIYANPFVSSYPNYVMSLWQCEISFEMHISSLERCIGNFN
jgi:hypothetical protein